MLPHSASTTHSLLLPPPQHRATFLPWRGASPMPGTMVNCCFTQELEEVANRLLPSEIFAEIGTVGTTTSAGTCRSSHAVIEELAMHLNSILGLPDMRAEHQPRQANTNRSNHWSNCEDGIRSGVLRTNGEMAKLVPGFCENHIAVYSAAEKVTFEAPLRAGDYQPLPVRQYNEIGTGMFRPTRRQNGSGGTGVFFPRAEMSHTRSSKSTGNNGAKPPRLMWKETPMTK